MNKQEIGEELIKELEKGYDIVRTSRWAFQIYSNDRSLDVETKDFLEKIFAMEDDEQFEMTKEELLQMAQQLIEAGKEDDLSKDDSRIKEIAIFIEKNWLVCPLCGEAWNNNLKYKMVRCQVVAQPHFKASLA